MTFFEIAAEGILLRTYVQPRSAKNSIVGIHGDMLKIKITSPPVEGKANKGLQEYVAKVFGISRSSVEIVKGDQSRNKLLLLKGLKPDEFRDILRRNRVNLT
jgi:uncharacterized protein (TIGR00251 family)